LAGSYYFYGCWNAKYSLVMLASALLSFWGASWAAPRHWESLRRSGFLARKVSAADLAGQNPETMLTKHAALCRRRGIGFLLVVLSDKIRNADEMIPRLQAKGVSVAGFLPYAERNHGADLAFWQTQDSRWTAHEVQIAAWKVFIWLSLSREPLGPPGKPFALIPPLRF
jgi:hypothetical protein